MLINISTASYDHGKGSSVVQQKAAQNNFQQIEQQTSDRNYNKEQQDSFSPHDNQKIQKESSNVGGDSEKLEISSQSDINEAEVIEHTQSPKPNKAETLKPQTPFVLHQNENTFRPLEEEENVTDSIQNSQKFVVLQSRENIDELQKQDILKPNQNDSPQQNENQEETTQKAAQPLDYVEGDQDFTDFHW